MTGSEAWDILKKERSIRVQKMSEGVDDLGDVELIEAIDVINRNYDMMYSTILKYGKIFK